MTRPRPIAPPSSEGNSGPRTTATMTYGTVIASAAYSANFHTFSPSAKRLCSPKKPHSMHARNSGIRKPMMACMIATSTAMPAT